MEKCRGEKKAILALADLMVSMGYEGGKMRIAHCLNPAAAETLKANILAAYPQADIQIRPTGGLCSFYAEKGGMIIGFEK
jgi:fatty acid-binding protein DegV